MSKPVVEVQVRAVIPTSGGCAVFIGNEQKVFVIYVDQSVGAAITMFMRGTQKERPLTHDLLGHILRALGAKGERERSEARYLFCQIDSQRRERIAAKEDRRD